jgi:hypothetical protein
MKSLNLKVTVLLILIAAAAQNARAVEIPDGLFFSDKDPVANLDLLCSRDWAISTCTLPPDFREELATAKNEFFADADARTKVLVALRQEALDAAELYGNRSTKYVGKSRILTALYDEARQEILKSDYLIELQMEIDANGPSSEAHAQFQKLAEIGEQYEESAKLPISERRKVRDELLHAYNQAQDLIRRYWNFATTPSENFPRLKPTARPVADSSNLNSNASLALVAGYRLVPADNWLSNGHIILATDRKLLEAMVLDSSGRENPIRLDEKELGFFGKLQLSYDAASRTVTHRYRYDTSGKITSLKMSLKDHLRAFLGVK